MCQVCVCVCVCVYVHVPSLPSIPPSLPPSLPSLPPSLPPSLHLTQSFPQPPSSLQSQSQAESKRSKVALKRKEDSFDVESKEDVCREPLFCSSSKDSKRWSHVGSRREESSRDSESLKKEEGSTPHKNSGKQSPTSSLHSSSTTSDSKRRWGRLSLKRSRKEPTAPLHSQACSNDETTETVKKTKHFRPLLPEKNLECCNQHFTCGDSGWVSTSSHNCDGELVEVKLKTFFTTNEKTDKCREENVLLRAELLKGPARERKQTAQRKE